jgi:hypothetical protein
MVSSVTPNFSSIEKSSFYKTAAGISIKAKSLSDSTKAETGTAVPVNLRGKTVLVTALHVVDGSEGGGVSKTTAGERTTSPDGKIVDAKLPDGSTVKARVVTSKSSEGLDLAILVPLEPLNIDPSKLAKLPTGSENTQSTAYLGENFGGSQDRQGGATKVLSYDGKIITFDNTEVQAIPGTSGAAITNQDGTLISLASEINTSKGTLMGPDLVKNAKVFDELADKVFGTSSNSSAQLASAPNVNPSANASPNNPTADQFKQALNSLISKPFMSNNSQSTSPTSIANNVADKVNFPDLASSIQSVVNSAAQTNAFQGLVNANNPNDLMSSLEGLIVEIDKIPEFQNLANQASNISNPSELIASLEQATQSSFSSPTSTHAQAMPYGFGEMLASPQNKDAKNAYSYYPRALA